jgi:hypothetical protein
MSRAKVAIDSKFPDASFWEILGLQGPKMTKSFLLAKFEASFVRAGIFL